MEDDKFKEAINILTKDTEHWHEIKKVLEDEIRSHRELIIFVDKVIKEKEDKISKLN